MATHIVIPSRYASTRLPAKPLRLISGKPMIVRVVERVQHLTTDSTLVATDDQRIVDVVEQAGGNALLTSTEHATGTDRLAEVAQRMGWAADDIVINVQGDEPLIPPQLIEQVATALADDPDSSLSTLSYPIDNLDDLMDPNLVKVVFDKNHQALYFSRAPIPWYRDGFANELPQLPTTQTYYRHIGIYAYRVSFLQNYVTWPAADIETTESLEQLRALWQGEKIRVDIAATLPAHGVDTEQDLVRVQQLFEQGEGK